MRADFVSGLRKEAMMQTFHAVGDAVAKPTGVGASGGLGQTTCDIEQSGEIAPSRHITACPATGTGSNGQRAYAMARFASGTMIATVHGPRPVNALRPGAQVKTRDNGDVALIWAGCKPLPGFDQEASVRFETGAIGNPRALELSQNQRVLLASPLAELYFGSTEFLVPAVALVGLPGVSLAPCLRHDDVCLVFEQQQILIAEGVGCESLALDNGAVRRLPDVSDLMDLNQPDNLRDVWAMRPVLTTAELGLLAGTLHPPLPMALSPVFA